MNKITTPYGLSIDVWPVVELKDEIPGKYRGISLGYENVQTTDDVNPNAEYVHIVKQKLNQTASSYLEVELIEQIKSNGIPVNLQGASFIEKYVTDNFDMLNKNYNYCIAHEDMINSILMYLNKDFNTESLIVDNIQFIKSKAYFPNKAIFGKNGEIKVSLQETKTRTFRDVINNRVYDDNYNLQAVTKINTEIKPQLVISNAS